MSAYVPNPAAVVHGPAAVVLDVFLRRRGDDLVEMLTPLPREICDAVREALDAITQAADAHKDRLPEPEAPRAPTAEIRSGSHHEHITSSKAAGLLGITQRQVTNLCKQGDLDAARIGGRWLIDRASIEARSAA